MQAAAGDENAVAGLDLNGVQGFLGVSLAEQLFKMVASRAFFQPGVDVGARQGAGEVPHLRLELTVERGCKVGWGMDLDRQALAGRRVA